MPIKKKRQRLLKGILLITFLIFLWWYNTLSVKINNVSIKSSKIKNDIVICQITDLHGYSFSYQNQRLIQKIEEQKPDLIAVTGDMYTYNDISGQDTAFFLMTRLTAIAPVYYVNGEHDSDESFSEQLAASGVHVLNYENEPVTIQDTTIHLYGINNLYYSPTFDLHHEWQSDSEHFSILLAHIPNFEKFADFDIDLSLCGDTHGGQIRLPFIGAVYTEDSWFPDLSGKYTKGLYQKGNHYLYISSGLGSYPIPLRTFNRPEISVITLSPDSE